MNGSNGYKGWDDRRLPVRLEPTPWARWVRQGGIFFLVLAVAVIGVGLWTEMYVSPIVIMFVFIFLIAAMGQVGQRERFDRLVPTRLHRGLCPKCFYRLDTVPPEEDNATVCPECGAAWVLPGKAKKGEGRAGAGSGGSTCPRWVQRGHATRARVAGLPLQPPA